MVCLRFLHLFYGIVNRSHCFWSDGVTAFAFALLLKTGSCKLPPAPRSVSDCANFYATWSWSALCASLSLLYFTINLNNATITYCTSPRFCRYIVPITHCFLFFIDVALKQTAVAQIDMFHWLRRVHYEDGFIFRPMEKDRWCLCTCFRYISCGNVNANRSAVLRNTCNGTILVRLIMCEWAVSQTRDAQNSHLCTRRNSLSIKYSISGAPIRTTTVFRRVTASLRFWIAARCTEHIVSASYGIIPEIKVHTMSSNIYPVHSFSNYVSYDHQSILLWLTSGGMLPTINVSTWLPNVHMFPAWFGQVLSTIGYQGLLMYAKPDIDSLICSQIPGPLFPDVIAWWLSS